MTDWFNVDKNGLAKLMRGRSKAFILYELISNAWDEASTNVKITISKFSTTQRNAVIIVEDDNPEGFLDISHAYTLFADSAKKSNAEQRGRFNLGEKLVLALAKRATITTTRGGVRFDEQGRHTLRSTRHAGSEIKVEIPMTLAEMNEVINSVSQLIPPPDITTTINGQVLAARGSQTEFETQLPTLIADSEGILCRTVRRTWVRVYLPRDGEKAMLYEMGIPVVETGDKYHVDIQQKVLLNSDRDNVTPAYLQDVRVAVLNHTHQWLDEDEASNTWVRDACADPKIKDGAIKKAIGLRFGENAVTFDASDPESNKISASEDRQLVHGAHLTAGEWENVRRVGILPPAGKVTPSPKPYSLVGPPLNLVPEDAWSPGMHRVVKFAQDVAVEILGSKVAVHITDDPGWPFRATYEKGHLVFNLGSLGNRFFDKGIDSNVIDLVIHEYGHHYESDHLSRRYNDALTRLGAKMTLLALDKPELFR
jgi:hypothetical protein